MLKYLKLLSEGYSKTLTAKIKQLFPSIIDIFIKTFNMGLEGWIEIHKAQNSIHLYKMASGSGNWSKE